jgi:hypothetical protein
MKKQILARTKYVCIYIRVYIYIYMIFRPAVDRRTCRTDICFVCVISYFLNKISESSAVYLCFTSKGPVLDRFILWADCKVKILRVLADT